MKRRNKTVAGCGEQILRFPQPASVQAHSRRRSAAVVMAPRAFAGPPDRVAPSSVRRARDPRPGISPSAEGTKGGEWRRERARFHRRHGERRARESRSKGTRRWSEEGAGRRARLLPPEESPCLTRLVRPLGPMPIRGGRGRRGHCRAALNSSCKTGLIRRVRAGRRTSGGAAAARLGRARIAIGLA